MRVIAGTYRSRPLHSLRGMDIRPTSDRLRETLFDVLCAGDPSSLEGTVWLDLFAGTGAVGIEALSRGAAMVYLVDSSVKAAELVRENLAGLGIASGFQVMKLEASRAIDRLEKQGLAVDYIFLDPPYRMEDVYSQTLYGLAESTLLKPAGLVIVEHQKRFDPGEKFGALKRFRVLEQGDAALSFYRRG
ncbi:MAG TPA: 16S rRNA (guanine(966)-N(2))-methyltransferase RsmD [Terriglobales bacterium]|nr:16S rRNA (guanine(966)-N(2))-methyltransferase RsmD [Terriglobales bacterium]